MDFVELIKRLLLFLIVLAWAGAVHAQQTVFVPSCFGVDDTAKFAAIIATIGSNQGTIRLPYKNGSRCAVSTLSIPSNITLDNGDGTGIKVLAGQTLTVAGPRVNPIGKQMFYGPGAVIATGVATAGSQQSISDPTASGSITFDPSIGSQGGEFFGTSSTNNPSQILRANNPINPGNIEIIPSPILTPTYTIQQSDGGKFKVVQNAGAVAITLVQAGTSFAVPGFSFDISVEGGGTATITSTGSTINGQPTLVIASGAGASKISNTGGNWHAILGGSVPTPASTVVSPDDYGAIHDGSSHLLSSRYATLAAAQAAYNGAYRFITSLSQEIDYAALKASLNAGLGAEAEGPPGAYITPDKTSTVSLIIDPSAAYPVNSLAGKALFMRYPNGFIASEPISSNTATTITLSIPLPYEFHPCSEMCLSACSQPPQSFDCSQYAIGAAGEHGYNGRGLNKPIYIPAGDYQIGNDTLLVRNLVGGHIYGAGRLSTVIHSNITVFRTDGLWYTAIEGIEFASSTNAAGQAVDIDGNVPGHPYATRTVQGVTFKDCMFTGGNSAVAFALTRQGGSNAQGSENLWLDCHWQNAITAFTVFGFNALGNTVIGGDMQNVVTGFDLTAGSVMVFGTNIESGRPYEQATQDGWDIKTGAAGVSERLQFIGIRSESLQVFKGSATQPTTLQGVQQRFGPGFTLWSALGNYTLHQVLIRPVTVANNTFNHAFYVKVAGTSGAVEPVWTATGDVVDGTITWTELPFLSVDTTSISGQQANTLTISNSSFAGPTSIGGWVYSDLTALDVYTVNTTFQLANWQNARYLIPLNGAGGSFTFILNTAPIGQRVTFKRTDSSGNTVTLSGGAATIDGGASLSLPALGSVMLVSTATNVWRVEAKNWGNDAATLNGASFSAPGTIGGGTPAAITGTTGTFNTSLTINGGTAITKILKGSVTIDPASINATTVSSQTFTLTGALVGDALTLNPPAAGLTAGLVVQQVFVSAGDQITVVFFNQTGAPIDQASGSWTYHITR
jgi:hypothetical protein